MARSEPLHFSLLQLLAGTAVVVAVPTLFRALLWPPIGRTGLSEALLTAIVLFAALWFCRRDVATRLWTVAIGGALIGLALFVLWFDHILGNLLFGASDHHAPGPWIIIAAIAAAVGFLAGWGWWANHGSAQATHRLTKVMMAALVFSSGCVALVGGTQMPRAIRDLDRYAASTTSIATPGALTIKTRYRSPAELAEYLRRPGAPNRRAVVASLIKMHAQAVLLPPLIDLLSDDDAQVRRATARTLDDWAENRLKRSAAGSKQELTAALQYLAKALDHQDAIVRQYAARFLNDPHFFDPQNYASLPSSAMPALIRASQSPEAEVRDSAKAILKAMESRQQPKPAPQ